MEFLIEKGVSNDTIDKIKIKYEDSVLDIVDLEEGNVLDVIDFLQNIGIKDIEALLIYRIELFTKDVETIKKAFNKQNISSFVEEINEDITNIDRL